MQTLNINLKSGNINFLGQKYEEHEEITYF